MKVLFFDPLSGGHHNEYPMHIGRYIEGNSIDFKANFVLSSKFRSEAPKVYRLLKSLDEAKLKIVSEKEQGYIDESSGIVRASRMWRLFRKYSRNIHFDKCVFLEINHFQPFLGLPYARKAEFDIYGILFFPYIRLDINGARLFEYLRQRVSFFRKRLLISWVLGNSSVDSIFLLNDPGGARLLNRVHGTNTFRPLPDPVFSPADNSNAVAPFQSGDDRLHCLFFGAIREQKGIRELIQAMHLLSEQDARDIELHVLGATSGDLKDELPRLIKRLRGSQKRLRVHYEDRFLEYAELEEAIRSCDLVLAPYQQTEGSSGVIGHAAKHRKPVIGPSTGLIGSLIREYKLGMSVDASNPAAIAQAIRAVLKDPSKIGDEDEMQRYVEERTPEQFVSTIIETLVK